MPTSELIGGQGGFSLTMHWPYRLYRRPGCALARQTRVKM